MDQVFAVRHVCEKYLANVSIVCGRCKEGMHGVVGKLLKAVQGFNVHSRECE